MEKQVLVAARLHEEMNIMARYETETTDLCDKSTHSISESDL